MYNIHSFADGSWSRDVELKLDSSKPQGGNTFLHSGGTDKIFALNNITIVIIQKNIINYNVFFFSRFLVHHIGTTNTICK